MSVKNNYVNPFFDICDLLKKTPPVDNAVNNVENSL